MDDQAELSLRKANAISWHTMTHLLIILKQVNANLAFYIDENIYPSLVLVQPRKTCPCLNERLLMGCKESNQTNKQTSTKMNSARENDPYHTGD